METFFHKDIASKKKPALSNILLDFLNRESREIFGLYNLSKSDHINFLAETINVAVFMCYEFCIENPGSIGECALVRVAFKRREKFFENQLIRMPMREFSLDDFWKKKEREYKLLKGQYVELYSDTGKDFIARHSHAIIHRDTKIGSEIIKRWECGPESNDIWDYITKNVPAKKIEKISKLPRKIKDQGLAIKGLTIVESVGDIGINPNYLRQILQNDFFSIYINEYKLRLISQLPYFKTRFGLKDEDLCYNYEAIRAALRSIKLWGILRRMSADSLVELRTKLGYFSFRDAFHFIAAQCFSVYDVLRTFSLGADRIQKELNSTSLIDKYDNAKIVLIKGFDLNPKEISAIDYRLRAISESARESYYEIFCDNSKNNIKSSKRISMVTGKELSEKDYINNPIIAIFVALQMEREILINRWSLVKQYSEPFWTGKVQNNNLILYGMDQIGRVPAAIATMQMFHKLHQLCKRKPDIIIATGIAGGFQDEGIMLGNIIIAESIADLAMRKIRDGEENIKQEFRPKEFGTDNRIQEYIKSSSFDHETWERDVIRIAEWPDGLRPAIRIGPIASMDEIVSSAEWVKKLRDAWPKLLGIEMEAGGICAAADLFGIKVNVIRGISDYADPLKSDDEWRKRSMKTIAYLLENLSYDKILKKIN